MMTIAYAEYEQAIDNELVTWLGDGSGYSAPFYEMMRYQLGLLDEAQAPVPHGKRERLFPLLCLVACASAGGSEEQALHSAAAIDVLSNYFSAHADIERHAASPSGRPAAWARWGDAQAINMGDGLFPLAGKIMLRASSDPGTALTLVKALAEATLSHLQGQHLELSFGTREAISDAEYLEVTELKIGALAGFAAWTGAVVAGSNITVQTSLRDFGADLGVAWYIHEQLAKSPADGKTEDAPAPSMNPRPLSEDHARQRFRNLDVVLERSAISVTGRRQLREFATRLVPL